MLVAKPVIDKQFWILQENDRKVGNVEACAGGYQVKINNQIAQFKTIRMVERHVDVKFQTVPNIKKIPSKGNMVHGFEAAGRVYNPVWDLKMKAPVYTRTTKSKSWYAAGWYWVRHGRNWNLTQDPKLIVLQRYPYQGPYHTQEQAKNDPSRTICR